MPQVTSLSASKRTKAQNYDNTTRVKGDKREWGYQQLFAFPRLPVILSTNKYFFAYIGWLIWVCIGFPPLLFRLVSWEIVIHCEERRDKLPRRHGSYISTYSYHFCSQKNKLQNKLISIFPLVMDKKDCSTLTPILSNIFTRRPISALDRHITYQCFEKTERGARKSKKVKKKTRLQCFPWNWTQFELCKFSKFCVGMQP